MTATSQQSFVPPVIETLEPATEQTLETDVKRGSCQRGHPFSILISSLKDHILISRMTLYTSHNNTLLIHPHSLCQAHIQSQIVQPSHQNLLISRKISMVTFSSTCFLVYSSLMALFH